MPDEAGLPRFRDDTLWRVLFIVGMLCGGLAYGLFSENGINFQAQASPLVMIIAGLLVGFGTRMGTGCTSGHAICGIARVSKRSFAATLVFMLTAIITVFVTRHLLP